MSKLKISFLSLFIIGLIAISVHARENWDFVPDVNSYVSEAVQLTSFTNTTSVSVFVSTYHATLHTVCITSAGVSSDASPAVLEVFDSNGTTSTIGAKRIASIDSTKVNSYTFDIYCSSGLSINNHGATPGTASIQYREK